MNAKLTLTIEQEVIEKAKKYAKQKGRSLSDLVENYFKTITISNSNSRDVFKHASKVLNFLI
jgi:predicted HicB family RNase H-like nuclease